MATVEARAGADAPSAPLLGACLAVLFWGLGPVAVRGVHAPSTVMAFWRMWLAVPLTFALARVGGARVDVAVLRRSALGGFLFAASLVTGWAAVQQTSVANATLIPALQPVLVLLLAAQLFGERVTHRDLRLAGVAVAGVVVFVLAAGHNGGASLRGDVWALANLVIWSLYFLEVKRRRSDGIPTMAYLAGVMLTGAILLTPYVLLNGYDVGSLHGSDWLLVLFIVLVPGAAGHGLMTWAQRFVDVSLLSLLTLASPVISAMGAWLVFGQALRPVQLLGGAVVLGAIGGLAAAHRSDVAVTVAVAEAPA